MLRIAIIDDSDLIRERLISVIADSKAVGTIVEAGSIKEAEALFVECELDVVLLDLRFPDGSGLTLLKNLMALSKPPKVIVLTNFGSHQYRDRCMSLGAFQFLDKSDDFQQIPDLIAGIAGALKSPDPGERPDSPYAAPPPVRTGAGDQEGW